MDDKIIVRQSSEEIKSKALSNLKGNWKTINLAYLIIATIVTIVTLTVSKFSTLFTQNYLTSQLMSTIINIFTSGFVSLGMSNVALKIARGEKTEIADVFKGFEPGMSPISTQLLYSLIFFTETIIFCMLALLFLGRLPYVDNPFTGGNLLFYFSSLILGILFAIISIGLSMTWFIKNDNPKLSALDVLSRSWSLMTGNKGKYFGLILSFIGWYLLLILVIIIGAFALSPLIRLSTFLFILVVIALFIGFFVGFLYLISYVQVSIAHFYLIVTGQELKLKENPNVTVSEETSNITLLNETED